MALDVSSSPSPSPSPWSSGHLPPKIAAAVLRRLPSHVDRVRFAAVCRTWRAAAAHQPRQPSLPWLALPDGTFFSYPASAALRFSPDAAAPARYHGSCGDCLLFRGDGAGDDGYLLVHPFSRDTIVMRLPGLSSVRFVDRDGEGVAWRGITDDQRAPNDAAVRKLVMCPGRQVVVAAMVGDGRRANKIAMCRPDSDSWVMSAHDAWRGFTDMAFYDGKVYAVADAGELFAMDVDVDGSTGEPTVCCARVVIKAAAGDAPAASPAMRYLLVSGGRLLMVHREVVRSDGAGAAADTIRFAVFMADLVSSRWSAVQSVGDDTALFVGRCTSLSRRVSPYGLPGNRIHFLDDGGGCPAGQQFGSYDMTDGATYPLLLPPLEELGSGAARDTPATWLFPWEQEGVLSWCDLPSDLYGLLLRRLPDSEDRANLSAVCRHWHVCAQLYSVRRRGKKKATPLKLMVPHQCQPSRPPAPPAVAAVATPAVAYLALPSGQVLRYPGPGMTTARSAAGYICAACDDWLLCNDDDGLLRLSSPLTGKTRLLPSLVNLRAHGAAVEIVDEPAPATGHREWADGDGAMAVRKLVLCPDGFVAAIVGREHFGKVALCSLETFSWTVSAHDRWRWYDDLACCGGRLFAVTASGDLLAFDVGVDGDTGAPFVSRVERVVVGDSSWGFAKLRYLVPSSHGGGEPKLLMVVRWGWHRSPLQEFTVFRADLEASRWVHVDRLGSGEALFVGRLGSRSVRARGDGGGGVRGDQIFFLPDDCVGMSFREQSWGEASQHHAAVYDMVDWSVTGLLPARQEMSHAPPLAAWLFPSSDGGGGK